MKKDHFELQRWPVPVRRWARSSSELSLERRCRKKSPDAGTAADAAARFRCSVTPAAGPAAARSGSAIGLPVAIRASPATGSASLRAPPVGRP